MAQIVTIVEGKTEAQFVRSTLTGPLVLTPFSNGKMASVDLICDEISDALEAVGGKDRRIVVLLDREKRSIEGAEILEKIQDRLSSRFGGMHFYIGVSDRHIENWIVADEENMRSTFAEPTFAYEGDGSFGMSALRRLIGARSMGPSDKARLLRSCVATRIAANSPSFGGFQASIDFDWPWIFEPI